MKWPSWYLAFGGGTVPVIEFPNGFRSGESHAIMELLNDLNDKKLSSKDPYEEAKMREFISLGSQIGLYMFWAILTKDDKKWGEDMGRLSVIL